MTKLNEHPFIEEFNKFRPLNQIIQELIPTIENYLEVTKIYKNKDFINFTYNKEKYKKIIPNEF